MEGSSLYTAGRSLACLHDHHSSGPLPPAAPSRRIQGSISYFHGLSIMVIDRPAHRKPLCSWFRPCSAIFHQAWRVHQSSANTSTQSRNQWMVIGWYYLNSDLSILLSINCTYTQREEAPASIVHFHCILQCRKWGAVELACKNVYIDGLFCSWPWEVDVKGSCRAWEYPMW